MLNRFLTNRLLGIVKPFKFGQIKEKLSLLNKCSFSPMSRSDKCSFEGLNSIQNAAACYMCNIGMGTYIGAYSKLFKVKIGKFCSIADHVRTGFGSHPTSIFVSTFPAFYYDTKNLPFSFIEKSSSSLYSVWRYVDDKELYVVEIGNDVWIGSHVLIMDGVKIGDGAIIAAGAVVTKNVEPYSIVGGVPAKHIKFRFNEEQIKQLLYLKWWEKDFEWIKTHYQKFQNIDDFLHWYNSL